MTPVRSKVNIDKLWKRSGSYAYIYDTFLQKPIPYDYHPEDHVIVIYYKLSYTSKSFVKYKFERFPQQICRQSIALAYMQMKNGGNGSSSDRWAGAPF